MGNDSTNEKRFHVIPSAKLLIEPLAGSRI
jgi:hypothetical protein